MNHMSDSRFSNEQFLAIYPPGIERYYWNHAKNMVVANVLTRVGAKGILDVGAGAGIVTAYLKKMGMPIWGVELAPVPLNALTEALGDNFFAGKSVEELPLEIKQKIDTVSLLDVIEHLEDPREIITSAEKALPNLQNIVITVPARQELWSNYDEFNGHYVRYDCTGLIHVFEGLGWHAESCGYYFHTLYYPAWLLAKTRIKRATILSAPAGWKVPLHALLAKLFYWEYKVLPRSLPGSSIVAVFKK